MSAEQSLRNTLKKLDLYSARLLSKASEIHSTVPSRFFGDQTAREVICIQLACESLNLDFDVTRAHRCTAVDEKTYHAILADARKYLGHKIKLDMHALGIAFGSTFAVQPAQDLLRYFANTLTTFDKKHVNLEDPQWSSAAFAIVCKGLKITTVKLKELSKKAGVSDVTLTKTMKYMRDSVEDQLPSLLRSVQPQTPKRSLPSSKRKLHEMQGAEIRTSTRKIKYNNDARHATIDAAAKTVTPSNLRAKLASAAAADRETTGTAAVANVSHKTPVPAKQAESVVTPARSKNHTTEPSRSSARLRHRALSSLSPPEANVVDISDPPKMVIPGKASSAKRQSAKKQPLHSEPLQTPNRVRTLISEKQQPGTPTHDHVAHIESLDKENTVLEDTPTRERETRGSSNLGRVSAMITRRRYEDTKKYKDYRKWRTEMLEKIGKVKEETHRSHAENEIKSN